MGGVNPGSLASQMPARDDDIQRKIRDQQRALREQGSANTLQAAQFGKGGILVTDNGSITISGTGSLNVGSGALNSAGSISAGTTITAGGNITSTGGSIAAAGGITGAALSVPGAIGSGSLTTGAITATSVGSSGAVSGTTGQFNSGLFSTAVFSTVVSGTRTATWTENTGTLGTAPSSIRFKTNVAPADWSEQRVLAVLGLVSKCYNYRAEVAKRDADPTYHVHLELGYIAEELHAAGLWEAVIYERDNVTRTEEMEVPVTTSVGAGTMLEHVEVVTGDTLRLTPKGEPIPFGIHYELLGVYAIEAARFLWAHVQSLESDMAAVKAHLGL